MPSILGSVDVERTKSVKASMARKRYMGSCRLGSVFIMMRRVMFPSTAMVYMMQKGKAIQNCSFSSPGMPARRKVGGWKGVVKFREDMKPLLSLAYSEGSYIL